MNQSMSLNKYNWRDYCAESPLSFDELELIRQLDRLANDDILFYEYLIDQTKSEYRQSLQYNDMDYESLVKWTDNNRRLRRAEIKAYKSFIDKEFM
jgi:hypothetical protein